MREELIQLLKDNNFIEESNGKQTRYKKEYSKRRIRNELVVVPNKQPLLFYTVYYKDQAAYRRDIKTTINSCAEIVNSFITLERLF